MAWKPMEPHERASIEAQVILKGAVELTAAQVSANATDPNEDILTTLTDNAAVLANILGDVKTQLGAAPTEATARGSPWWLPWSAPHARAPTCMARAGR